MPSNPLLKFKDEILITIVLPKLEGLLYKEKGDLSVNELWKLFREEHDCTVSLREFKEWCSDLQLRPQQTTVWNLPKRKATSTQTEVIMGQVNPTNLQEYTSTDADIDEVLFDNET